MLAQVEVGQPIVNFAEYFETQVLDRARVVVAPTVTYHFYPAFVEYPGSTSLRLETARDVMVDICRSLARFGPRRFYVLDTGVSTVRALRPAADVLAAEGILMRFTELTAALGEVEKQLLKQEGGTHADEGETSMVLFMDPASVDMSRAVKDYNPRAREASHGGGTRPHVFAHGGLRRSDARHAGQGRGTRRRDDRRRAARNRGPAHGSGAVTAGGWGTDATPETNLGFTGPARRLEDFERARGDLCR